MSDTSPTDITQDIERLRSAVILITRFISDNIMDPHSGFEGQFLGAGRNAVSCEELLDLLRRVLESLDIVGFPAQQLQQLDVYLRAESLPQLSSLRRI